MVCDEINLSEIWIQDYWTFDSTSLLFEGDDEDKLRVRIPINTTKQMEAWLDDIRDRVGLLPLFRENANGEHDAEGWYNAWLAVTNDGTPGQFEARLEFTVESPNALAEEGKVVYEIVLTQKQTDDALAAVNDLLECESGKSLEEIFEEAWTEARKTKGESVPKGPSR